ncbi:MAG TPA: flagellar export protein FliJ [archaeon]|nr:flagellar export protein FliJ [archaeon]
MKQFEFRLQKVMETTRTREELKKRELAHAMAVLSENETLLEVMIDKLDQQLDEYHACRKRPSVKVSSMMNFSRYTERLVSEIREQKNTIDRLAEQVMSHREKLIEISKDKKILEKLKEKRYEEFKKKLRSMEQKFMDELSIRAFQNGNGIGQ